MPFPYRTQTVTISGEVYDTDTHEPLQGTKIDISFMEVGEHIEVKSNRRGQFKATADGEWRFFLFFPFSMPKEGQERVVLYFFHKGYEPEEVDEVFSYSSALGGKIDFGAVYLEREW